MTMRTLTLLIVATLTTEALAQGHTIYGTDGNVVGRYTTTRQGTTTLYGRDGRVISRATGNTVTMHDGVSGQVFGDRPKRGKRR